MMINESFNLLLYCQYFPKRRNNFTKDIRVKNRNARWSGTLYSSFPYSAPNSREFLAGGGEGGRKHLVMFRFVFLKVDSAGGCGEDMKDVTNSCHSAGSFR